jgi:hypothetical protein
MQDPDRLLFGNIGNRLPPASGLETSGGILVFDMETLVADVVCPCNGGIGIGGLPSKISFLKTAIEGVLFGAGGIGIVPGSGGRDMGGAPVDFLLFTAVFDDDLF